MLKILGFVFLTVLILYNTYQLLIFQRSIENVDKFTGGAKDELGSVRQNMIDFAADLNEIRSFLLLPEKKYAFTTEKGEDKKTDEQENTKTSVAIYSYLTKTIEDQNAEGNIKLAEEKINTLSKDSVLLKMLQEQSFKLGQIESTDDLFSFKIFNEKETPLFAFIVGKKNNIAQIQSAVGLYKIQSAEAGKITQEVLDYIQKHKKEVEKLKNTFNSQKESIENVTKNTDVAKIFAEKNITLSEPEDTNEALVYYLLNVQKDKLTAFQLQKKDGTIVFEEKTFDSMDSLLPVFLENIKNLDTSSREEKMIKTRRKEMETVFQEKAFQELLKANSWTISSTPREEYNKLIYDLKNSEGKVIFSFVIELSSGLYKILQNDQEIDLFSILEEDGSKKKI